MNYVTRSLFALFGFLTILNTQSSTALAQGTAFTYQGRLSNNGSPASGIYNLQFTVYATNQSGSVIAGPLTNSAVTVTNGLFTTIIDFGPGIFTGQNCWLDIAVSTNGNNTFTELAPRQPVTPAPYAIMANSASNLLGTLPTAQLMGAIAATNLSGTLPSADLSGTYGNVVSFGNGADSFDGDFFGQFFGSLFQGGTFTGQFLGDGSGLININPLHVAGNLALLNSNQTFIAQNVFMQPIGLANPNPSPGEQIDALAAQSNVRMVSTNTLYGAVLELKNLSSNPYEYLGAINFNDTNNYYPGQIGYIANSTNANFDYFEFRVGGNVGLTIQADPRGYQGANILGGFVANSISPVLSGGDVIAGGGFYSVPNTIYSNTSGVFIGAGSGNQIGPDVNDSVIPGGYGNVIQSYDSIIEGGEFNFVSTNAQFAVIGGGYNNTNEAYSAIIGGGGYNVIRPGAGGAVISGGSGNRIDVEAYDSFIGAGAQNVIASNAVYSAISSGDYNTINTNNNSDVINGGFYNFIDSYSYAASIGGGYANRISGNYFYFTNYIPTVNSIGGGYANTIDTNTYADTIGGGSGNDIQSNADYSTIGGGAQGTVLAGANESVISGGYLNHVAGGYSTVPGGYGNLASGAGSFAAGTQAQATNNGSFVLADNEFANFYSSANNQLSARFIGGIVFVTGGAGMTLDGQPIFYGSNGANLTNVNAATLNGLTSAAFAPASGSANYIQNQSGGLQTASFNITGTAGVGGLMTSGNAAAASLNVTNNASVGGTLSANSLTITNQFRVAGAGIGTATTAFIQLSTAANISGDQTIISNSVCDGDPNAILIATHNYNVGSVGFDTHPFGVYYNGSHWTIYNDDSTAMAVGVAFNVLVIKH